MKVNFATIREIQDVLMSKIFCYQNAESYLFDDGTYAVLPGDLGLLIRRNYIDWNNMNPKRKYSIIPHESGFIFRTYENEIYPGENDFFISIDKNENDTYAVTLESLGTKKECLKLVSD